MQQRFDGLTAWYTRGAGFFMRHGGRAIIVIVIMLAVTAGLWRSIPAALVPEEDQGYVIALPFLPPAASQQRTSKVMLEIEKALADHPAIYETIRSEEHTSELQSLMRNSYAVFCLKKKKTNTTKQEKQ